MYYEEKVIDGVMHWRTNPDEAFTPYTLKSLTERYVSLQRELMHVRSAVGDAADALKSVNG